MQLETERLILREYQEDDFESAHYYASQPDFSKYDAWGPNNEDDTRNFIQESIQKSLKNPRYEFELAVVLKAENKMIGGCGIRRDWEKSSFANFGYAINPDYQGKGIATEATEAIIKFGFEELKLAVIYATCDIRNIASYKVMEKLGMRRVAEVNNHKEMKGAMRNSFCYEILNPKIKI